MLYISERLSRDFPYIYNRSMVITPIFLDKTVYIHTGNGFYPLEVLEVHLGSKFGDWV